jgi:hypothetical protein
LRAPSINSLPATIQGVGVLLASRRRHVAGWIQRGWDVLEVIERFADGLATEEELRTVGAMFTCWGSCGEPGAQLPAAISGFANLATGKS